MVDNINHKNNSFELHVSVCNMWFGPTSDNLEFRLAPQFGAEITDKPLNQQPKEVICLPQVFPVLYRSKAQMVARLVERSNLGSELH